MERDQRKSRRGESLSTALESLEHIETVNIENTLATLLPDDGQKEHFLTTALQIATKKGLVRTVSILLENGAGQVVDVGDDYGNTPLIMAALHNYSDILCLLIQAGCDVNRTDMMSRTALHWVAMNGDEHAAAELLEHGAVADKPDSHVYNFTPLMLSARQGHTGIVRLLLEHHCHVNKRDNHGETPLFDAVRNNNVDCVELLLQAGADVDALDIRHRTALFMSIQYDRPDAMRRLIAWNCDVNLRGTTGIPGLDVPTIVGLRYSPLEVAIMEGLEVQCNMLVAAGADTTCLYRFLNMRSDSIFTSGKSGKEWMKKVLQNQLKTLKDVTRTAIRRFYGPNLPRIVDNLPLPNPLKGYLTLPEVTGESS